MIRQSITLYTIPHTGTNFVVKFFGVLGLKQDNPPHLTRQLQTKPAGPKYWLRLHPTQLHDSQLSNYNLAQLDVLKRRKPTIVTARDPYLSTIRYLKPGPHRTMIDVKNRWDRFFRVLPTLNYHIIDIGCDVSNRYEHLCEAAKFLKIDYKPQKVKDFADAWKPENASNSDAKRKYLETGELPEGYDWSLLDEAVEWYTNLQYSP